MEYNIKKIILANDHAAVTTKFFIYNYLKSLNYNVVNLGTNSSSSTHYPYYALSAANTLKNEDNSRAILLCSSGVGISLAANKIKGVRCMLCNNPTLAQIAREEFNINMLGLGANVVGIGLIKAIVDTFLSTPFNKSNQKNVDILNSMLDLDLSNIVDPANFFNG